MISVIVPVYNSELYLEDCLNSILGQTYREFELILIDDGSQDNSLSICEQYSKIDNRVQVWKKENGGPSEARNFGVSKSKGKYITFIDSDDIVDTRYLDILISLIVNTGCDIGAVGLTIVKKPIYKENLKREIIEYDGVSAIKDMLYQKNIDTSPCALLLKREIVVNNPFPIGKFHEDDFTVYKYFLEAKKISIFKDNLYFYIQRESGIMNSTGKVSEDEIEASNNLVAVFENIDKSLYQAAISKKFSNYCQLLLKGDKSIEENGDIYNEILSFLLSNKWKIIFDSNCRMKNKIAAFSLIFGSRGLFMINKLKQFLGKK